MKIRKSKDFGNFDFTNEDHIIDRCKNTKIDTNKNDNFLEVSTSDLPIDRKASSVSRIDNPSVNQECNSGKITGNSIWDSSFYEKEIAKKSSKELSKESRELEKNNKKELEDVWNKSKIPEDKPNSIYSDFKYTEYSNNINIPKKDISLNDGGDFSRFSDPDGEKIEKKTATKEDFINNKQKTTSQIENGLIDKLFGGKNG